MKLVSSTPPPRNTPPQGSVSSIRRAQLAKVHLAKKQLDMAEGEYRALLHAVTGKTSAGACSEYELARVLDRLKQSGFRARRTGDAPGGKAHVGMVLRLWAALGATGALSDPSESALRAFVRRQTVSADAPGGVAAPQFLTPKQAEKVIEGLKAWLARVKKKGLG